MNEKERYAEISLLETAKEIMKKKKKPRTLESITKEVFEKKNYDLKNLKEVAQFELDFMASGLFIYCGTDKKGNQLWDFKDRQKSALLDKDVYADLLESDEEVTKNELREDNSYEDKSIIIDDDEDNEGNEVDDIQEDLGLIEEDSETTVIDAAIYDENGNFEYEEDEEENSDVEDLSNEFEDDDK